MVNIFVHSHPVPRSNRSDDMGHFHFRDLEMTPRGQSRSKVKMHFYQLGNDEHFCSYGHPGSRRNRLDDTGHFHFRDLEMTSSRSSEVKFLCGF